MTGCTPIAGLLCVGLCTAVLPVPAQDMDKPAAYRADAGSLDYRLRPRQIAPAIWVLEGAVGDFHPANGCNIINTGWIDTPQGTLLINTGPSRRYGRQQRMALQASGARDVVQVLNLNLHPDYFFGNQAWSDRPLAALAGTVEGMGREGRAYADNLYALCGEWMKDTEPLAATQTVQAGAHARLGPRIELLRLQGHTADDLVVIDHGAQVVFAGGLVFAQRIPTTPHADIPHWLASLDALEQKIAGMHDPVVVPSHGPVHRGTGGIAQTREYLQWLQRHLQQSAARGMDISEVLATALPPRFAGWAAARAEYARTVTHLYPRYELDQLSGPAAR